MKFFHCLLLTILFCASKAEAITNIAGVLNARTSERGAVVRRLTGTIIVFDARYGHLVITDGTSNLFVRLGSSEGVPLQSGQQVLLNGTVNFTALGPYISQASVIETMDGKLPEPKQTTIRELREGKRDWQYVEVRAKVRQARASYRELQMELEAEGDSFDAVLIEPSRQISAQGMQDATFTFRGIAFQFLDQGRTNRFLGISNLEREESGFTNRPIEVIPVSQTGQTNIHGRTVRLRGTLREHPFTRKLYLRDSTGQIAVSTLASFAVLPPGEVQLEGVLEKEDAGMVVERSTLMLRRVDATNSFVLPVYGVAEINQIPQSKSQQSWPVYGEGTVTFFDPKKNRLYLQWGTWTTVIRPSTNTIYEPGEYVAFWGTTLPLRFAPEVASTRIEVLKEAALPASFGVKAPSLYSGRFHSQRIELTGVIQDAVPNGEGSWVKVFSDGHLLSVYLPSRLVGEDQVNAEVRVRAVCDALSADGTLIEPVLLVSKPENLRIISPAPTNAFDLPTKTTRELGLLRPHGASGFRVKISGIVSCGLNGKSFFVQDAERGIHVTLAKEKPIKVGDSIEVAGFPSWTRQKTELRNAEARVIKSGVEIPPKEVALSDLMIGAYDTVLVKTSGEVVQQIEGEGKFLLLLKAEDAIFTAEGPIEKFNNTRVRAGSRLELTGVALSELDEVSRRKSVRLLLRTPADIELVEAPPFWTRNRILGSVGALCGITFLGFIWVAMLRRQVNQQTKILKENMEKEASLERQFSELFEKAHDIVYSHDFQGNAISLNPAGEKILGYSREELLKMNMSDLLAPDQLKKAQEMTQIKEQCGGQTSYELEVKHKDGRAVLLEVSSWLAYQNGKPFCVRGIARDITHRKQLDERLRHSQRMECIGQLAAGVAHDFNNLLTVIQGNNELALMSNELKERTSYAQEISITVEKASHLVKQLLTFSRQQVIRTEKIEVNATVGALLKMLARLLGEQIRIDFQPWHRPLFLQGDKLLLEQAITNLAVNARDAMPEGGVLFIRIELRHAAPPGNHGANLLRDSYVSIVVKDTGSGIPKDIQDKIFDPFFTTKDVGKGTGLGLSMVYGTMKQHNGWVEVESTEGEGSTFTMNLPAFADSTPDQGRARSDHPSYRGTETILLVDDEEELRELAARTLRKAGYQVITADSGVAALQRFREKESEIDLVLTDIIMPEGISGTELASFLYKEKPELTVVFTSGIVREGGSRWPVPEGAPFLSKPFSPVQLLAAMREALDKKKKGVTLAAPTS